MPLNQGLDMASSFLFYGWPSDIIALAPPGL